MAPGVDSAHGSPLTAIIFFPATSPTRRDDDGEALRIACREIIQQRVVENMPGCIAHINIAGGKPISADEMEGSAQEKQQRLLAHTSSLNVLQVNILVRGRARRKAGLDLGGTQLSRSVEARSASEDRWPIGDAGLR